MAGSIVHNVLWLLIVALGVKLIRTGARARSWPEALLGLALLATGPGVSLLQTGLAALDADLLRVGLFLVSFGSCCISAFAVITFRPETPWARGLLGLFVLGYAAGLWHQLGALEQLTAGVSRPSPVFIGARFVGFAWCAYEAARYRGMYVKRLAIGLADPVIANRFLLYAVWTAALAAMPVMMGLSLLLDQTGTTWRMGLTVGARVVGVVVLISMWLIFMPPRAYLRFIETRHARASGEAAAP